MNILEALKANETKTVISPTGFAYKTGVLVSDFAKGVSFLAHYITHGWTVEEPPLPPLELWVNVYRDSDAIGYSSIDEADKYAAEDRICCVHMREVRP